MKAVIQHTFNTGLGDALKAIHEYFTASKILKDFGYTEIKLILSLGTCKFFFKEMFFEFFNEDLFKQYFDIIETIDGPIITNEYQGLTCVRTHGTDTPGAQYWDLFLEPSYNVEIIKILPFFKFTDLIIPKSTEIFNPNVVKMYEDLKIEKNLNHDFITIYFRSADDYNHVETYHKMKDKIKTLIEQNEKIYVCSNSYEFKKYVKLIDNKKTIFLDIFGETTYGNHLNSNSHYKDDLDKLRERFNYVIYECLLLSEAKEIFHFTVFNRISLFVILAELNNVKLNMFYIELIELLR